MKPRTKHILLLTGPPGVGKTTVIRRVSRLAENLPLRGIITDELREDGQRRGFVVSSLAGARATLAHVNLDTPYVVGRYRVDVEALDRLTPGAFGLTGGPAVYLIDEIGKMECLSDTFVQSTEAALAEGWPVVATVGQHGDGLIARVKRRPDVILRHVTPQNRNLIPGRINAWLRRRLQARMTP